MSVSDIPVEVDGKPSQFFEKVVRFSVEEAFRGVQAKTVELVTSSSTASCGYDFLQGERYFVYARRRPSDGKLTEGLCGPTERLADATSDFAYVRDLAAGEKGARAYGAALRLVQSDVRAFARHIPVAGVEITLELGNQALRTLTDEKGRYEFRGVPPGLYRIRARPPEALRELYGRQDSRDHFISIEGDGPSCDGETFALTSLGSISGRLVSHEGTVPPQLYVTLVPLGADKENILTPVHFGVYTDPKTGRYHFKAVPPGRFLLAIKPEHRRRTDPAYPQTYHPGVGEAVQSTVIVLGEHQALVNEDFRLPPPLAERWFTGRVLLADRTAASGARVFLIDPTNRADGSMISQVTADESGRFRIRGYESYEYWIDASSNADIHRQLPQSGMFSPPVQLPRSGSVTNIELMISSPARLQPYLQR